MNEAFEREPPNFKDFYKKYIGSGEDFDPSFINSELVLDYVDENPEALESPST